jgi:hypothetical protein
MRTRLVPILCALTLAAALAPRPARAATRIGLGADYHLYGRGIFQLTLDVDTFLARHLSVGGRFGALLASTPTTFGVPVDVYLRLRLRRIYLQGLIGPWILFYAPASVRLHAAFGFGLEARGGLSVGLEVGWLDPSAIVGLRLAWRI